jgi:chromosome segregation ATPase
VAATLAQAVQQQQAQLAEVQACQVQLLTECQELAQREGHLPQGVDEAMLQELPARHVAMAKELESLQGKFEEVAAGMSFCSGTNSVAQQMQAIEGQLRQLKGERGPGAAEYSAFSREIQGKLQDLQQQVLAVGTGSGSSPASQLPEAAAHNLQSMELQLQAWQGEKSQLSETMQSIMEQQRQFQLVQQQQQQELLAALARAQSDEEHNTAVQELRAEVTVIASAVKMLCSRVEQISTPEPQNANALVSMVSRLSERVEKLEPREPPQLALALAQKRAQPQVEPGESAQALRQQVSALMGNVSWLSHNTAAGGLGRTSLGAAGNKASLIDSLTHSSSRAPSPRKWLSEPLSVAVARSDLPSSTSSPLGTSVGGLGSALAIEQQRFVRPAAANAHVRNF